MDQIEKIHAITGTPSPEILATMKRRSTHVEFDFPHKVGQQLDSWNSRLFLTAGCLQHAIVPSLSVLCAVRPKQELTHNSVRKSFV